jgi:hypothetical protein
VFATALAQYVRFSLAYLSRTIHKQESQALNLKLSGKTVDHIKKLMTDSRLEGIKSKS